MLRAHTPGFPLRHGAPPFSDADIAKHADEAEVTQRVRCMRAASEYATLDRLLRAAGGIRAAVGLHQQ